MKSKFQNRKPLMPVMALAVMPLFLGLPLAQTGSTQQLREDFMSLEFRCPTYVLAPQPITLLADLPGAKKILGEELAKRITYRWEVSKGKIIAGQGTPSVTIDPSGVATENIHSIDVKIILGGGPPELEKERSCSVKIDPKCPSPVVFAQYESILEERQYLDRLGKYLTSESPESAAFIVAYAGLKSCLGEAVWRANRAKNYLVDVYKLDLKRVVVVDGGNRNNFTIDLVTSISHCGPVPTPTVSIGRGSLSGSCEDKYKELLNQRHN